MNKFKELIKSYKGSSPLFFYEECVLFPKVENNFIVTDQNYIDMIKSVLVNNRFITVSLKKKDNKRLSKRSNKRKIRRSTKRNSRNVRKFSIKKHKKVSGNDMKRVEQKINSIRNKKSSEIKKELEKEGIKVSGKSNRLLKDIYFYSKVCNINIKHE